MTAPTDKIQGRPLLFKVASAATTNATLVKAGPGVMYGRDLSNSNAAIRYMHFYDKVTVPVPGTDVPLFTIALPANALASPFDWDPQMGVSFKNGIGFSITTGAADTDATALVAVGDVNGALFYV